MAIFSTASQRERAAHQRGRAAAARLRQRRDVVEAFVLALERPGVAGQVFNVGSGNVVTIREVAELIARASGASTSRPRHGAISRGRHPPLLRGRPDARERCWGSSRAYRSKAGLSELAAWLASGHSAEDNVERARRELASRGLAL
jgi:dTDP-L-rhamnose 4-epimerase